MSRLIIPPMECHEKGCKEKAHGKCSQCIYDCEPWFEISDETETPARKENILGEKVRVLRGARSLREFANLCKISHTRLDSIEKGIDPRTGKPANVTIKTISNIAMATKTPLTYFLEEKKIEMPFVIDKEISIFQKRLKEAMEDKTVTEFAEKIGLSKQIVSAYITGKRNPKQSTLKLMAEELKVSVAWLTGYSENKQADELQAEKQFRKAIVNCELSGISQERLLEIMLINMNRSINQLDTSRSATSL